MSPLDKFVLSWELTKELINEMFFSRYFLGLLLVILYWDITDSKYNYTLSGQFLLRHSGKQDLYLMVWAFKHYKDRV